MMTLLPILATLALLQEPKPIDVWPGKAPGETGAIPKEILDYSKPGQGPWVRIRNVSRPTLSVYPAPKDKNTGVSVLARSGDVDTYSACGASNWNSVSRGQETSRGTPLTRIAHS